MTLSITGSPVLIGDPATIGQIEFLPTDMDAVDGSGRPTSETLLIARTPHTNESRNRINTHLSARDLTYGSMAMHEDGTAYVVAHGTYEYYKRGPRTPVMDPGHGFHTVHGVKHGIPFYRPSYLIMADPHFATHPAVNMTWYESALQAAVLEDAHKRATGQDVRVRMMRDAEYTRFVTWDGKYTKEQVKARAHLNRDGVTGTASVADEAADLRTTDEGFVDPFGNVWIWTDSADARPATGVDMDKVLRIFRGTSWRFNPQVAHVGNRRAGTLDGHSDGLGVRWVAILRENNSGPV